MLKGEVTHLRNNFSYENPKLIDSAGLLTLR